MINGIQPVAPTNAPTHPPGGQVHLTQPKVSTRPVHREFVSTARTSASADHAARKAEAAARRALAVADLAGAWVAEHPLADRR